MSRFLLVLVTLLAATFALSQTSFPTEFPPGSTQLDAAVLKQLLAGKTFVAKPVDGPQFRIQHKDSYVFFNSGNTRDTGRWKTEGSSVCIEWNNIRSSCSEIQVLGSNLYVKRANNGEVVRMEEQ